MSLDERMINQYKKKSKERIEAEEKLNDLIDKFGLMDGRSNTGIRKNLT